MPEFFADHSADYASYRPRYPEELFEYLVSLGRRRHLAWDCATGNGQAAQTLARHFERVIGSDLSLEQIVEAPPSAVSYLCASAEAAPVSAGAVDLLTVAQAAHWLDFDTFYAEARRVMAPSAVIAVWTYSLLHVSPAVDRVISRLYHQVVGPYWPPERRWVEDEYRSLPFPFAEETAPRLAMEVLWDFAELVGYLATWSACRRYAATTGRDPLQPVIGDLKERWGPRETERRIRWQLHLRVGRNS